MEVKFLPYGEPFSMSDDELDSLCEKVELLNKMIKKHGFVAESDIREMFGGKAFESEYFGYVLKPNYLFWIEEHPWNTVWNTKKIYWIRYGKIDYIPYKRTIERRA